MSKLKKMLLVFLTIVGIALLSCSAAPCEKSHYDFIGYSSSASNNVIQTMAKVSDGYKHCNIIFKKDIGLIPYGTLVKSEHLHYLGEIENIITYEKCYNFEK